MPNMIKKFPHIFLCFCFLLLSPRAFATDPLVGVNLHGLAVVRVRSRHVKPVAMEQVVSIQEHQARFVGITDFANVFSQVLFSDGQMISLKVADDGTMLTSKIRLQSVLSLPLAENDFLALLAFRCPESFQILEAESDLEVWVSQKKKKMIVEFFDFAKVGAVARFPRQIRIKNGKNYFELTWKNVSFHSAP